MSDLITQCRTCGVEYDSASLPSVCPICADERQYLPIDGVQAWVRPGEFDGEVDLVQLEPNLVGIDVHGSIGIGQRAKVLLTDAGAVMVDVPAAITAEAVQAVRSMGDVRAIVATHPHMFGVQSLWSDALGGVPVWVSRLDSEWLGHRPAHLREWDGIEQPVPGVTAVQPGGHFPGSAVVHWHGKDGAGVLLAGDTIAANPDRRTVTMMRSYPNRIPLSARVVERIATDVRRFPFARLYDNFSGHIPSGADQAVSNSAERFADWANGRFDHLAGPGVPPAAHG